MRTVWGYDHAWTQRENSRAPFPRTPGRQANRRVAEFLAGAAKRVKTESTWCRRKAIRLPLLERGVQDIRFGRRHPAVGHRLLQSSVRTARRPPEASPLPVPAESPSPAIEPAGLLRGGAQRARRSPVPLKNARMEADTERRCPSLRSVDSASGQPGQR